MELEFYPHKVQRDLMPVLGDRNDLTAVAEPLGFRVSSLRARPSDNVEGETERTFLGDPTGPLPQVPRTRNRGVASSGSALAEGWKHKNLCNQTYDQSHAGEFHGVFLWMISSTF